MIPDSRIWRTIGAGARRAATWPFRVAAARATLRALAKMDRRELADIGLNPSDVRDASALPLDRDPTELLARAGARAAAWLRRSEGFPRRRRSTPRPATQGGRTRLDCISRDDRRLKGGPAALTGNAVCRVRVG